MTKHSPGPWRAILDEKPDAEIWDANGLEIAKVYFDSDRREADARLIAKAPELLEALDSVCCALSTREDLSEMERRELESGFALIREIEGE